MSDLTRKQFFPVAAAGSLAGSLLNLTTRSQAGAWPKNVLLLMADQHKPHALGIDGDPVARTPNLDSLARSGLRFDQAYCSNPVCVPSRASLLTGLWTHNHHAYSNATPWPFDKKTIAHYFNRAGYMTALIGKMHFVDAQTHGFDYRIDFNDWWQYLGPKAKLFADELGKADSGSGLPQIDDLWRDFGDPWEGFRENDGRKGMNQVGRISKIPEQDHFESFVARESIRFLKNHGKSPFLLVTSFLKPHNPFMPSERFAKMFRPQDMKLPDTWGKVDFSKAPAEIRRMIEHPSATPELLDPEQAKIRMASYYASLAQMDDSAGRVLNALHDLGLDKDTIVLYTSDHGDMLGEHGLWAKFTFYESSVGVPLIFRVPGLTAAAARSRTPVSLVQVVPTVAELCGVPVNSQIDGESLVRDLRDPQSTRDTTVFSEFNLTTPRAKYMIRHGDFKYNHYVSDMPELYNLRDDPKEMRNLAMEAAFQPKLEEMKAQLFAWYRPPVSRA